MADQSNPTLRVLNVISLLASRPGKELSLAELARRLSMSKASAHRLLTTMADADFLARDPVRKTYGLGMTLVGVGQAALERHRELDRARREMARLAVELDIRCSASALIGGDLIILAKEGVPRSHEAQTRVGERCSRRRPRPPRPGPSSLQAGSVSAGYAACVSPRRDGLDLAILRRTCVMPNGPAHRRADRAVRRAAGCGGPCPPRRAAAGR